MFLWDLIMQSVKQEVAATQMDWERIYEGNQRTFQSVSTQMERERHTQQSQQEIRIHGKYLTQKQDKHRKNVECINVGGWDLCGKSIVAISFALKEAKWIHWVGTHAAVCIKLTKISIILTISEKVFLFLIGTLCFVIVRSCSFWQTHLRKIL